MYEMNGIIKVAACFYFLVLRKLLFIGCVESNPGPMVKGIDYKQNLCEEVSLMQFSLKKLQEEIYKFQEENNKLKKPITLTKANIPNQETTGRWNNSQDRKIPGLKCEISSALKNGKWMKCVEIIRKNIPTDDRVYKKIQTICHLCISSLPHAAAQIGYVELIQVLVNNGLNVNEKITLTKKTMLHSAAEHGSNNVVEFLLSKCADIEVSDSSGCTPLHYAAQNGHVSTLQLLIEKGADINSSDNIGSTPLHDAAYNGHVSTVQLLIEKGADINSSDSYDWTPLHYAALNGHVSTMQLLIEKGADINPRDNIDSTPLHYATNKGYVSVVKCLLDNNCNRQIKNIHGKTPLDIARDKVYSNIVGLLDK